MDEIEYEEYKEELPEFMAGYGGHKSLDKKKKKIYKIIHTKHIPGYTGFVPSIKSENKFGESYGKETSESISGTIPKGTDVPSYVRYTSLSRNNFIDQSRVHTIPTSRLLGVRDKSVSYRKPISFNTLNKYYDVKPNRRERRDCEKQIYEQDYLKFWDFVDQNELDFEEKKKTGFKVNNMAYWGVKPELKEIHPEMRYEPIVGYMGNIRSVTAENVIGMSFKKSLDFVDELNNKKYHNIDNDDEELKL